MRRPTIACLALVAAALAASADGGIAGGPRLIRGDSAVGPIRIARTTSAQAIAALAGAGAHDAVRSGSTCRVRWPRLSLAVDFAVVGTDPRNPCTAGVAIAATVTGRGAWRTALGLRVGDPVARVRRLYPRARLHDGSAGPAGYWLVPRRACEVVGAFPYPGLLARTRHGHVTALVAATAICD